MNRKKTVLQSLSNGLIPILFSTIIQVVLECLAENAFRRNKLQFIKIFKLSKKVISKKKKLYQSPFPLKFPPPPQSIPHLPPSLPPSAWMSCRAKYRTSPFIHQESTRTNRITHQCRGVQNLNVPTLTANGFLIFATFWPSQDLDPKLQTSKKEELKRTFGP